MASVNITQLNAMKKARSIRIPAPSVECMHRVSMEDVEAGQEARECDTSLALVRVCTRLYADQPTVE